MQKRTIKYAILAALPMILAFVHICVVPRPGLAQEPVPQVAPTRPPPKRPPPPRTGFIPPEVDLSHLTGQKMPAQFVSQALPSKWDWRTQGKVTSVKNQGNCGSCYSFASIGNIESKMLIDGAGTYDFSENNAKECNWRELNNYPQGSCDGGNYQMLASLFSQLGTVLETCDPYVASDVSCKTTCPYQKTLLDWRIISGDAVPSTTVLKTYIYNYGPVYTSMYAGDNDAWETEFGDYNGSYTLYHAGTENPNHAVLIIGWDNSLTHAGGTGGWIVKNSWGTSWGGPCGYGTERGYFTIAYGSANIGWFSSFIYDWQDYDNNGGIMYYDDDYAAGFWGCSTTTAWGLCKFIPSSNTKVTRVEFWTSDSTTDVDVYIYDNFNVATTTPSNLLRSVLNNSFAEAGYHSVMLPSPLPVTSGNDVIVVVKFTNSSYTFPVPADPNGPYKTQRTYISCDGSNGSWTDLGTYDQDDVAIRLRTSVGVVLDKFAYLPIVMKNYGGGGPCGFDSQFNGSAPGWETHSGTWTVDSNYYSTTGLYDSSSSTSYAADYTDFDYQARLWRDGCNTCANRLLVRGTPYPLASDNRWYSYYSFQYSRDGDYSVWKRVAGGSSTSLQSWTYSSAINQGSAWNTLRVVANGSNLSYYINGTLVWSGSDSSLASGRVGIGMYSDGTTGDKLRADWATLTCTGALPITDRVSAEQQALNDAANRRGGGSEEVAPSNK